MESKDCKKCGEVKSLELFHVARGYRHGRHSYCIPCRNAYALEKYREHRHKRRAQRQRYRRENDERLKAYAKEYRSKHKAEAAAYHQERRKTHLGKLRDASREYARQNPTRILANTRKWRAENPERVKEQARAAYIKRSRSAKARLGNQVKAGLHRGLQRGSKAGRKTFDLLGYSLDDLARHLERGFASGMSWENIGEWHIDHIVPLSAFNYESPDDIDFKRAWALSNLQPLWASENLRKHTKLEAPFQPSLRLSVQELRP